MPQRQRWLFAAKLFVAAMIAYALSVRMGLGQNAWPIVTCCAIANPVSSSMRAKATYRLIGTVAAGLIALTLAGWFGHAPLLIVIATGIVATVAIMGAAAERTPRTYMFQLGVLTLCIILLFSIDRPDRIFENTVSRVTQIALGILCTVAVDCLAPVSVAPRAAAAAKQWIAHVRTWFATLTDPSAQDGSGNRATIIADLTRFSTMADQLRYDHAVPARTRRLAFALQHRILAIVPLLNAIERWAAILPDAARQRVLATAGPAPDDPDGSRYPHGWSGAVEAHARAKVQEATAELDRIAKIEAALEDGAPLSPALAAQVKGERPFPLLPDIGLMIESGLACALVFATLATIWWSTGWAQGGGMVLIGVVALAFTGTLDRADLAVAGMAKFMVLALLIAGLLTYVLLPLARDFAGFAAAIGVVLLPVAAWAATSPMATILLLTVFSNLNLGTFYNPLDFGAFLDAFAGSFAGIFVAFYGLLLARRLGEHAAVERLMRQGRSEIARLARGSDADGRRAFVEREVDRIGQLLGRSAIARDDRRVSELLAQLRVGVAIADLGAVAGALDEPARARVRRIIATVGDAYGVDDARPALAETLDAEIAAIRRDDPPPSDHLLGLLLDLRLAVSDEATDRVDA